MYFHSTFSRQKLLVFSFHEGTFSCSRSSSADPAAAAGFFSFFFVATQYGTLRSSKVFRTLNIIFFSSNFCRQVMLYNTSIPLVMNQVHNGVPETWVSAIRFKAS